MIPVAGSPPAAASPLPAAEVLTATLATQAVASWGMLALAAVAPAVAESVGVAPHWIGYQISLAWGLAAIMSVPAGWMVRRWGPCRISQIALTVLAAGAALATIPTLAALASGSVLMGAAYALTNPSASALLVRIGRPERRNLIFSVKQTGVPLGGFLAGLIGPSIAVWLGWSWSIGLVALITLSLAAALQLRRSHWDNIRDPAAPLGQTMLNGLVLVWRDHSLRWLCVGCFLYSFSQLCLVGFLVVTLVSEGGRSLVQAGMLLALAQISGAFGRVLWGWVADRVRDGLGILALLGIGMGAAALIVVVAGVDGPIIPLVLLVVLFGASAVGWNGVYIAEIARLAPAEAVGTATGGSLAIIFSGVLIGPALFSSLHPVLGTYGATYGLLVAAGFLGCGALLLARRAAAFHAP